MNSFISRFIVFRDYTDANKWMSDNADVVDVQDIRSSTAATDAGAYRTITVRYRRLSE